MLIDVARQAVIDGISKKLGYSVPQNDLPPDIKQSIESLADVQKNLYIMREVLNGERSRIQNNSIRSFISKHRPNKEINEHVNIVDGLQEDINNKVSELSDRIRKNTATLEMRAKIVPNSSPAQSINSSKTDPSLKVLKCPTCGAPLPMPTSQFIKCKYCSSTISIQDFGLQLKSMIDSL